MIRMLTAFVLLTMFVSATGAFADPAASAPVPRVTAAFCDGFGFGYRVGDAVCVSYRITGAVKDVVFDFDRLPRTGDMVANGTWEVRNRTIEEITRRGAILRVITYRLQTFAVVTETKEVPFGPFEVYWTTERNDRGEPVQFTALKLPAVKAIVSPLVPPQYKLKDARPMHPVIRENRWLLIRTLFALMAAFVLASVFAVVRAILIEASRRTHSFLRAALAELKRIESHPETERVDEGVAIFRNALIRKFNLPGAAVSRDVRDRIRADEFWGGFVEELVSLWDETDLALMENVPLGPDALRRMQDVLRRMERREKDDPQVR